MNYLGHELEGYELSQGAYRRKESDERGRLWSGCLGLWLELWEGVYGGYELVWLRFYTLEGALVLTPEEAELVRAEAEAQRAEAEGVAREQAERQAEAECLARQQTET